jgi:hypothetical protein
MPYVINGACSATCYYNLSSGYDKYSCIELEDCEYPLGLYNASAVTKKTIDACSTLYGNGYACVYNTSNSTVDTICDSDYHCIELDEPCDTGYYCTAQTNDYPDGGDDPCGFGQSC